MHKGGSRHLLIESYHDSHFNSQFTLISGCLVVFKKKPLLCGGEQGLKFGRWETVQRLP